jgi:hypothetical protein
LGGSDCVVQQSTAEYDHVFTFKIMQLHVNRNKKIQICLEPCTKTYIYKCKIN